jgi:hypothetical protein
LTTRKKPAQPAVAQNTGSVPSAVSSTKIPPRGTPLPKPSPDAAAIASGERDVDYEAISCAIDDRGELVIFTTLYDAIRLTPAQTLTLGDFLRLTEAVWRM